jgi:4-amino-4-deoxy-L-arabinose transferase-like glycosyltransferase
VRRFLYAAAVGALLASFWLQMFLALPKLSATTDEVAHLPAGYTYWATRDFRLNPEHPPLVKLIAALPLLAIKPHLDLSRPEWQSSAEYLFGYSFLYTNNADRLLFWGRLPMTLLATLGGFIVFLWARQMFGPASGLYALALYAFSPNLLAHGMLVTTDVPVAVFVILTLYLTWKQAQQPSALWSAGIGLATGAAMACKFTGGILPLIVVGSSAVSVVVARDRRRQAIAEARSLAIAGISALAVLEAAYLFTLRPWTYFANMALINANHNKNHHFYLFGNFSLTGWWYYFPLAFVMKATIPTLVTIALAAVHLGWKKFVDHRGELLILATVVTYALAIVLGADDLGVRYLLPVFPLLFVWGSRTIVDLKMKPAGIALMLLLMGWQARAAIGAFPNYIPYFNEIVGGPEHGIFYLDDSNVDWGQNMKQAAEYIRRNQLANVELLPFSPFDSPHFYGIERPRREDLDTYRMMISDQHHPGVYIVSAHHLTRMMYIRPEWNPRNAVDRIGDSLWVFRF